MPSLRSTLVPTAPRKGRQKLGQPVPLSYLVDDANNGCPSAAQTNAPLRFS